MDTQGATGKVAVVLDVAVCIRRRKPTPSASAFDDGTHPREDELAQGGDDGT